MPTAPLHGSPDKKIAVILAGGAGRRFGSNKAFARIGPRTFLETLVGTLVPLGFEVCLSVADPEPYAHLPYRKIPDILAREGPLQALYSVFTKDGNLKILLLGCDMPLVSREIISLLWSRSGDADICLLGGPDGDYPLPAVYAASVAPRIKTILDAGKRRLKALWEEDAGGEAPETALKIRRIGPEFWQSLDPHGNALMNINTGLDLAAALSSGKNS